MNRKIAALVLATSTVLLGACGGGEPEQSGASDQSLPEAPTTTWKAEDLKVIDVEVTKPPANAPKVDVSALPEELANYTAVPGLSEEQQTCLNGAMKAAIDADPSLKTTPGKQSSVSAAALTACDGGFVFTDPLVEGLASGDSNPDVKLTPEQTNCFKQAFATDKEATAKVIANSMVMSSSPDQNVEGIKAALAPFEAKCGASISAALVPPS